MIMTIIVAFDQNFIIGKNNSIPWHFPEDLANFKKLTTNNICIMGRNTWESLPSKFRPLPNRTNIIISSTYYKNPNKFSNSLGYVPQNAFDVLTVPDLDYALVYCDRLALNKEIFLIGGAKVYAECLSKNYVEKMIVTKIKHSYEGDTKFPEIDWNFWNQKILSSNENFEIIEYTKK